MMRRIFSPANVLGVASALAVLYVTLLIRDSNTAVVAGALLAGAVGAAVWYVMTVARSQPTLGGALEGIPCLGAVPPDGSTPAPALTESEVRDRFTAILREIEGHTTGRVLLVSSPAPGQGASRVALSLAIAASSVGRRVMLVDADASPNGTGRYLSSGRSPGLSDVARGTATLAEATRMWVLEDGSSFPMLPAGDELADSSDLAGILVADALDVVSEHADLIIIDVPPVMWSSATDDLGAHADGTVLVLTDTADPAGVARAIEELGDAGAPVLGFIRNRSDGTSTLGHRPVRGALARGAALAGILLLAYSAYTGAQLLYSWSGVEKEALDTAAVAAMRESTDPRAPSDPNDDVVLEDGDASTPSTPLTTAPTESYETLLIIGNDEIAGAADVILYLVRPTNGADPFMVSLPRDLYVENPCTGGNSRINTLIKGCPSEDINGPTLLSYQVGEITGIEVDHFAWFDFEGFTKVIDAVGGVEVCVDNPVRDDRSGLDLPAGCTETDGEQALAWVRSRHTEQLVNGTWRSVPGASDLQRNQHQQDVILQLFARLKTFDSPTQLTTKARSLADNFVLDDQLSISSAVNLAWGLRGIDIETIRRLEIPVRLTRTTSGQSVLVATASFDEVLAEAYGDDLPSADTTDNAALTP